VADGLHSPLTKHGGWPVVDGVATSYNSAAVVARNKYLVPLVEAVCPSLARLVVAAANPKAMHYIDGARSARLARPRPCPASPSPPTTPPGSLLPRLVAGAVIHRSLPLCGLRSWTSPLLRHQRMSVA